MKWPAQLLLSSSSEGDVAWASGGQCSGPCLDILRGGRAVGSALRVFFSVKQSQLGHWSLQKASGCLDLCYPDKAILARVCLDDLGQGPVTGEGLVFLQNHHISFLQVGLHLPPLSAGLEGLEVLLVPSVPEVLDHGLAHLPFLE